MAKRNRLDLQGFEQEVLDDELLIIGNLNLPGQLSPRESTGGLAMLSKSAARDLAI